MSEKVRPLRIVAAKDGYQNDAFRNALSYVGAVIESRSIRDPDIVLLTHTKHQLHSTSLSTLLGDRAASALYNGKEVRTSYGTMRHVTLRTMGRLGSNSIVIAFYAEHKMLDAIDAVPVLAAIVAVPDLEGGADIWVKQWGAVVHGQGKQETAALIEDSVVVSGMKSLTLLSNISYSSLNPRDVECANEIFRILRNKGHELVPDQIKAWLVREGWHPGAATQAASIAQKVSDLKSKPSIAKFHDPIGRYQRWVDQSDT